MKRKKRTMHGKSKWPEYAIWLSIRQRCLKVTHKDFPDYGGRGITLAEEWYEFNAFISAVGRRPYPWYTIERVDNDKGYCPGNVIWADQSTQNANRRPIGTGAKAIARAKVEAAFLTLMQKPPNL